MYARSLARIKSEIFCIFWSAVRRMKCCFDAFSPNETKCFLVTKINVWNCYRVHLAAIHCPALHSSFSISTYIYMCKFGVVCASLSHVTHNILAGRVTISHNVVRWRHCHFTERHRRRRPKIRDTVNGRYARRKLMPKIERNLSDFKLHRNLPTWSMINALTEFSNFLEESSNEQTPAIAF